MSAKSIITAVSGFLSHHIGDLTAVHTALSELVSVAPIDSQDKDRIKTALDTVENSARNIENFLAHNDLTAANVVVKESDIVHALGDFFNTEEGRTILNQAVEGNAHASS